MTTKSKLTELTEQKVAKQLTTMSREAIKWLRERVSELKDASRRIPTQISKEEERYIKYFGKGKMYFFYYDPKTKDELPYYDRFPLVLVLERYSDGFLGLNLHYLPIKYRLAFMKKLLSFAQYTEDGDIKRMAVSYDILNMTNRFPELKVCVKRYLKDHIKSKLLAVKPEEWDVALFLPIQQFRKAKPENVWRDSTQEIKDEINGR